MSEKIFAFLLRLYPAHFRQAHGHEALQLFRDRARDEKGFPSALRLWFDLLADFAISLPREYLHAPSALMRAPASQGVPGAPSFFVLEDESLSPGALLSGSILSLLALGVLSISLSEVRNHILAPSSFGLAQRPSKFSQRQVQPPKPPDSTKSTEPGAARGKTPDARQRQRVIEAAVENLKQHYNDRNVAQKMADSLLAHKKNGDDDVATDPVAFADLLTKQMREVSQDKHLVLVYSPDTLPDHPMAETAESLASYRTAMHQQNCTFEKVQMLPHNIGYLKLNSFPDVSVCRTTATAAMAALNGADALIVDLRDNRGGFPDMVAFMAAYLFDHPEYLYNPRENTTRQSWTQSPVHGNRLADKPVYILTSSRTISGAEQFCYDLKMLKRATLVGERTAGSAHSGVFHRIDDHFGMGISEAKPINPFSETDWEGTGVDPHVHVNAADALQTAEKLAVTNLRKK